MAMNSCSFFIPIQLILLLLVAACWSSNARSAPQLLTTSTPVKSDHGDCHDTAEKHSAAVEFESKLKPITENNKEEEEKKPFSSNFKRQSLYVTYNEELTPTTENKEEEDNKPFSSDFKPQSLYVTYNNPTTRENKEEEEEKKSFSSDFKPQSLYVTYNKELNPTTENNKKVEKKPFSTDFKPQPLYVTYN